MKDWYCYIDNQTYGPYPENLLKELINRGQLAADTYVYNNSPEEAPKGWQRAGDTEIAVLFLNNSQETPPLPPIQNKGTTRISPEVPEENAQNQQSRLSDKGEAQIVSSNNTYELGRRQFMDFSKKQIAGFVGSIVLFAGVFCPIVSMPIIGNMNYFQGDGKIILVFAAISIIVTLIKKYKWLWFTGLGSLGIMLFTFVNFLIKISEMESEMKSELAENPFSGFADLAVRSIQLQWGWAILIIGVVLIIVAAILKEDEYRGEGGLFDEGIRSSNKNNQKTRSFCASFVHFSKKQIIGLVCSACVVFILALTLLGSRQQNYPPPQTIAQTQTSTSKPKLIPTSAPNIGKKDATYKITYSNAKLYKDLIGSVCVRAIVEITNAGTSDLYLESSTLDFEDESGSFVSTLSSVSVYPKVISPGEKAYYYKDTIVEGISANTTLTIVAHPKIYEAKIDNVRACLKTRYCTKSHNMA